MKYLRILLFLPNEMNFEGNGFALQYLQPQEICLAASTQMQSVHAEAIKYSPYVLEYIDEQTPEMCLAAVNKDIDVLKFIRDNNLQKIIQKINESQWDDEVLSFIHLNPEIENSFSKEQKMWYNDYCNLQLTKSAN